MHVVAGLNTVPTPAPVMDVCCGQGTGTGGGGGTSEPVLRRCSHGSGAK